MNNNEKKNLIEWAETHPEKVQILKAGLYEGYEVKPKYGNTIKLPDKYTVIIVPDQA